MVASNWLWAEELLAITGIAPLDFKNVLGELNYGPVRE
jgi:hypothetical protein